MKSKKKFLAVETMEFNKMYSGKLVKMRLVSRNGADWIITVAHPNQGYSHIKLTPDEAKELIDELKAILKETKK